MLAKKLCAESKVIVVSPSYGVKISNRQYFLKAIDFLGRNFKLEKFNEEFVENDKSFSLEYRIKVFNDALRYDAVLFSSGGRGAKDLLPYIEYGSVVRNKPLFFGFSDHTYLLNVISLKTGLVTFHGADVAFGLGKFLSDDVTKHFMDMLSLGVIDKQNFVEDNVLVSGFAKGILFGGNMECFIDLIDSDLFVPTGPVIVFVESLLLHQEEFLPSLKRLFSKKWSNLIKGLIIGHFNLIPSNRLDLDVVSLGLKIPVIHVDWIGHVPNYKILPIGLLCSVNTKNKSINFLANYLE